MTLFAKKITRDTTAVSATSRHPFFRKANDGHGLFGQSAEVPFFAPQVQPKLIVNAPGDALEKEADRVAESITGGSPEKITPAAPATVQRKEEEAAVMTAQPETAPEIPGSFEQSVAAKKGGGQPLPGATREEMEEGIGADFGDVRIHTGTEAAGLSQSISAQAFTHGNDIFFNEGKYAPGSPEGKHLLAHELTHTVQQGASQPMVQRAPGDDQFYQYTITIPPGITSSSELDRYAELKIFGRVVNIKWAAGASAQDILNDLPNHAGRKIIYEVRGSTLAKYRLEKGDAKDAKAADQAYRDAEGEVKDELIDEINKRYYESTGVTPGTQIKKGETGKADIWNDFKRQVMEQQKILQNLSPAIKEFLHTEGGVKPKDFAKLIEVVKVLEHFNTADFLEYKGIVNSETTDLDELKQSLQNYLDRKQSRQADAEEKEVIKMKLHGMEKMYVAFKEYVEMIGMPENIEAFEELVRNLKADGNESDFTRFHDQLESSLQVAGFKDIQDFYQYILRYEEAFEKATIAIAEDHLMRYRHMLYEEEKKINDDAYITSLYEQIRNSGAQQHFDRADELRSLANGIVRDLGGYARGDVERKAKLREEASSEDALGNAAIKALPSELVGEDQFDKEELAGVSSKEELKALLKSYIEDKKESIQDTWETVHEDHEYAYDLDKLMPASLEMQQIEPTSIFGQIISDKAERINDAKIFNAVCLVILAIALTIVTFGAAGPWAIAAGIASAGISLYGVYEAVDAYKRDNAANDVGLLTDDPSLIWVVLAIGGAAIDVGALTSALKAAKPLSEAAKAFDASTDATRLVKLEKDLAAISDLSEQIQKNILKSAEARAKAGQIMKSVFKSDGTLKMVIVPGGEEFAKIVASAFFMVKKGVIDFHTFMLELKAAKLIDESVELTLAEQKILKDAFSKAKSLASKDEGFAKTIEKAIKESNFTKLDQLINGLDFTPMNIPGAISHVKFRDLSVARSKGIGGCHDASEFAKISQADAATYVIPAGKLPGEVPEVLIVATRNHPTVPGVQIIDYKIPALDKASKTTGGLKNIADPKTVYDPAIWTDAKLEQALKEAFQDAFNKNDGVIPLTNPTGGLTSEGYKIIFTYRNGNITSFWFD
jgi:hypothetical protein